MPAPPFGTASAYSDSFPAPPPKQVTISAETCYNLGMFKDMVKQYRRLDDQIITRLNRAQAQLRDQDRLGSPLSPSSSSSSTPSSSSRASSRWHLPFNHSHDPDTDPLNQAKIDARGGVEGMCTRIWTEMMAGWAHRQTMLSFCLTTVNSNLEKRIPKGFGSEYDERSMVDGRRERGLKEDEVVANSLANEESVEAIIRKRTLDAFKSRCPYFSPSPSDTISRGWYDLAESGRPGRGPEIA